MTDDFARALAALDEPPAPPPAAAEAEGGIDEGDLLEALSAVIDPEIGLDVVTLGLVYALEEVDEGVLRVTFSLTTPGCPMEAVITDGIVAAASAVPGVREVLPQLVWEPRWHPGMIQEGAW